VAERTGRKKGGSVLTDTLHQTYLKAELENRYCIVTRNLNKQYV